MFNMHRPQYIIYLIELLEDGEKIDTYPYPMVPNVNDTIQLGKGKSFVVTDRIFTTFSEGPMTPVFPVKLNGKVIIDEQELIDTETLENKESV